MYRRKAQTKLQEWKARKARKPLILRGARQVGKSTLVNEFGKNYKSFVTLNLERSVDASFFKTSDRVREILDRIILDRNITFIPHETLLFIDEIQEVPEAIALLRYFYEELPEVAVIAAGSLLEFAIGEVPSFPVGRVEFLSLYPMDFEEFMEAIGEDLALECYRKVPVDRIAHEKLMSLFHTYMIIGGMPDVIKNYVAEEGKISGLRECYSSIWDTYSRDVEKYGSNDSERRILRHIISTAPHIRDRITFNGFGNSNYRSREVGEAFRKLDKSGLIRLVYPTSNVAMPLMLNYKRKPRIQFLDTGLLNYAAGIQADMMTTSDMNKLYKGYLTNHMVVQELIATSQRLDYLPPFWTRENANANAEVDLVISHGNKLIPVEVKSGKKGRLRSLHEYMDRCEHHAAVRLLANRISVEVAQTRTSKEFCLINLPYYLAGNIRAHIDEMIEDKKL